MNLKLTIVFLFLFYHGFAQNNTIHQLRMRLNHTDPIQKINTLNALSEQFYGVFIHSDSSLLYARRAYELANRYNYLPGKVKSLVIQSEVYGRLLEKLDLMEQKSREAILLMKGEKVNGTLLHAYGCLVLSQVWKGKFDEAHKLLADAKKLAQQVNEKSENAWLVQLTGLAYLKKGDFWKSFEYLIESAGMGKEIKDSLIASFSLALIARAFNYNGDPQKAIEYYLQSLTYKNSPIFSLYPHMEDLGYAYLKIKKYDSSLYYQQKQRREMLAASSDPKVQQRFAFWQLPDSRIDAKLAGKKYDEVLKNVLPVVNRDMPDRDLLPFMHGLLNVSRAYEGKENYEEGIKYARKLLIVADATSNHHYQKDGNELMAILFEKSGRTDSAYKYFRIYSGIKDEMDRQQFALRTALYSATSEANAKMNLLQKEKQVKESQLALKERQLEKQSQLQNLLIAGMAAVLLISFLVFRNIVLKRKNEKLQNEQDQSLLKRKALELEMQALRAQMNPHFIFNCLSAIDNLIQTNQADKATSYLSRFAKLIRSVLDSSKNNLVSFQRDFETLKLYLEMEKFRCNNKFNFNLSIDEKLMNGDYQVPPLIIQPFVENAIHHGLLNKQDNNRTLEIRAMVEGDQIVYEISDNGIGRKQAQVFKNRNRPEHKSYGIDITRERINLYNKNGENDIEIFDLVVDGLPSGTRARIRINS